MTPRFKLHKNGNATISGVSYNDLRSILTAARLYRYAHPPKPEPLPEVELYAGQRAIVARNNASNADWHRCQAWILDALKESVDEAVKGTYPAKKERPLKERLRENERDRQHFKEVFEAVRKEYMKP